MTDQTTETTTGDEGVEIQNLSGDAAFGALMDVLVAEDATSEGGEAPAGEAGAAPEAGAGSADGAAREAGSTGGAPAVDGTPAGSPGGSAPAGAPESAATGADGEPGGAESTPAGSAGDGAGAAAGDAAASGSAAVPADWTAEPAQLTAQLGEIANAFEKKVAEEFHATALEETRKEYGAYFDAIEKHPRLLVGQEVPAIGKEGMETLRDAQDAKDWQEAVKSILVADVQARANKAADEARGYLETVHSSIELFQNNPDLIPGGKGFDVELANRFAKMAKGFETRVDGKLRGYSVPVQPLIDQIRADLKEERAAAPPPAAPAAPAAQAGGGAPAAEQQAVEPPQAGIQSKAGTSTEAEDFSTLFGTIGLPDLRI